MIANGALSPPIFLRGKSGRGHSFKAELSKPCAWQVPIPHPLFLKTFMGRRRKANPSCPLSLVPCPLSPVPRSCLGTAGAPSCAPSPDGAPGPGTQGAPRDTQAPEPGGGHTGTRTGTELAPAGGVGDERMKGRRRIRVGFGAAAAPGSRGVLRGAVFGPQNRGVPASPGGSREGAAGSSGWGEGKDARPSLRTS